MSPEVKSTPHRTNPRPTTGRRLDRGTRFARHLAQHGCRRKGERFEVVAALQHHQSVAGGDERQHTLGQGPIVASGEREFRDWVVAVRVETCGHDDPRRREPIGNRRDQLVECSEIHIAGSTRRQRNIDGHATRSTLADLGVAPGTWVQRPLMQAHEQHARVVVEDRLRAISVVRVVVENHDAFALVGQRCGRHRNVVDEAETHRLITGRVVTRRTYGTEGRVAAAFLKGPHRCQPGTGCQRCRCPRTLAGIRVGIQATTTGSTDSLNAIQVRNGVHSLQVATSGRERVERHNGIGEPSEADAIEHGLQALGALGMARPRKMFEIRSMSGEQHGHEQRRYRLRRSSEVPHGERAATVRAVNSRPSNSTPRSSAVDSRDSASVPLILHGNGVSCRVQHWSFQPRTAQLVLYHQQRLPTLTDLLRWSERLTELGYTTVRTTALAVPAGLRAETAGFHVIQELVLLEHTDPRHPANSRPPRDLTTRKLVASQYTTASAIDVDAFTEHWGLESRAIADVCAATPRFRARGAGTPLSAYALSGRDAKQGFLQRLAVAPSQQRAGLGSTLVLDSLKWMALWRVQRVLVNTPADNVPALALYEQLGFRRMGERLRVYERELQ